MTEYLDYLSVGQDVTVTFAEGIISGKLTNKTDDGFTVQSKTEDQYWTVNHVGGARKSDDDTDEWPQYEIELDDDAVPVRDVRHGHYSLNGGPSIR